ncbi:transmembrane amino acid transporter protein-domain-containing protein [Mrakia frigida]|uniref:transmembrane amino acid transporter protein-domain-containing protein n=1 Tax=Mrakia frigida TaxID=29902 RepID=UPI003FCBEEA1
MSFPKPISLPSSPGRGGGLAPPGSNPGSFTPASSIPNIPLRVPSPNTSGVQTSLGEKRAIPLASSSAALGGLGEASGLSASLQQKGGSGALAAEGAGPSGALTPNSVTSPSSNNRADPFSEAFDIKDVTEEDKLRILSKHLVSAQDRRASAAPTPEFGFPSSSALHHNESGISIGSSDGHNRSTMGPGEDGTEEFTLPYDSHGGDVTHDLYKWAQDHGPQSAAVRKTRSASFSHPSRPRNTSADSTFQHIKEPGGFRRAFIRTKALERGEEGPRVLRSTIEFLYLFGHFAGEDLEEEDEDEEDDDGPILPSINTVLNSESTPLLGASTTASRAKLSRSLSRRRKPGTDVRGTASVTDAVFMLLKAFIGTGVLFMGRAFFNGGILFSSIILLGIGFLSLWSFLLLVETRSVVPGSFGDIGGALYGSWMRTVILASIAFSQIGFVAAYTIFVAENLQAFFLAVTDGAKLIDVKWLILAQMAIFLPLSLVRSLTKLSGTALIADAFILVGLVYIASNEVSVLATSGIADVQLFNPTEYPLLIGTAVFAFEGIGLVLPIYESMEKPEQFTGALSGVMAGISVLFAGAGVLSYAAYGSEVKTVVISNLPQDRKFVQVVQFLYSLAILLSTPLQLFPAVRIMENGLLPKSGKKNHKVKWQKNLFRAFAVTGCMVLAWLGSNDLDKFVSIVGSFACIPLCYIYPPLLHLRSGSHLTRTAKGLDYALIVFGFVAAIYTTYQTLALMAKSG